MDDPLQSLLESARALRDADAAADSAASADDRGALLAERFATLDARLQRRVLDRLDGAPDASDLRPLVRAVCAHAAQLPEALRSLPADLARHDRWWVRECVAAAVAEHLPRSGEPGDALLRTLLADPDRRVVVALLRGARRIDGALPAWMTDEVLRPCLARDDAAIRGAALALAPRADWTLALERAVLDVVPVDHAEIARGLAALLEAHARLSRRGRRTLKRLLRRAWPDVLCSLAQQAPRVLAELPAPMLERIARRLERAPAQAAQVLAALQPAADRPAVLRLFERIDAGPLRRLRPARLLARLRAEAPESTRDPIEALLDRLSPRDLLVALEHAPGADGDALRRRLADHPDPIVGQALVLSLEPGRPGGDDGDDAAVLWTRLQEAAADADPALRRAAALALLAQPASWPEAALLSALHDTDDWISLLASEAAAARSVPEEDVRRVHAQRERRGESSAWHQLPFRVAHQAALESPARDQVLAEALSALVRPRGDRRMAWVHARCADTPARTLALADLRQRGRIRSKTLGKRLARTVALPEQPHAAAVARALVQVEAQLPPHRRKQILALVAGHAVADVRRAGLSRMVRQGSAPTPIDRMVARALARGDEVARDVLAVISSADAPAQPAAVVDAAFALAEATGRAAVLRLLGRCLAVDARRHAPRLEAVLGEAADDDRALLLALQHHKALSPAARTQVGAALAAAPARREAVAARARAEGIELPAGLLDGEKPNAAGDREPAG